MHLLDNLFAVVPPGEASPFAIHITCVQSITIILKYLLDKFTVSMHDLAFKKTISGWCYSC